MRFKHLSIGVAAATLLIAASCSTPKNITYFQDMNTGISVNPTRNIGIKVRPEDKLSIIVVTQDPALSNLFNLVQSQNSLGQNSSAGRNTSNGQTVLYTVDPDGNIHFPVLGKLHVGGMTRSEVTNYIENELISKNLVKDPIVTVEFANTGILVLGEVSAPGRYEFNKDHLTVIDAIAMAGDLTPNGQRENVVVMRADEDGQQTAYRIDLTDFGSIATSPVYYLQQDDMVYVEPNDKKKRETTPNGNTPYTPSFWVSMGSFAVTIATLIITLSK